MQVKSEPGRVKLNIAQSGPAYQNPTVKAGFCVDAVAVNIEVFHLVRGAGHRFCLGTFKHCRYAIKNSSIFVSSDVGNSAHCPT